MAHSPDFNWPILIVLCLKIGTPKVEFPAPVIRLLPGYNLSCLTGGARPIYVAISWNSTVMANTTNYAKIQVNAEGNYTCLGTNEYGTDKTTVTVIFEGREGNTLIKSFYHFILLFTELCLLIYIYFLFYLTSPN